MEKLSHWLRLNMVLMTAAVSVGLWVGYLMISGTMTNSNINHSIESDHDAIATLQRDMISVDQRLKDAATERAALDKRVLLMEFQVRAMAAQAATMEPATPRGRR